MPVVYQNLKMEVGYRADMIVEDTIIVENKCVEDILPIHEAQMLAYLKLRGSTLGFILNWNVVLMKDGIRRFVNHHPRPQKPKE